ncbi:hypothetical protein BC835DRAFT_1413789 [Cytidiella melzeri]|nr:hypothetical protein BC835DRAFT_1413789 [Cytidiella melzeri]
MPAIRSSARISSRRLTSYTASPNQPLHLIATSRPSKGATVNNYSATQDFPLYDELLADWKKMLKTCPHARRDPQESLQFPEDMPIKERIEEACRTVGVEPSIFDTKICTMADGKKISYCFTCHYDPKLELSAHMRSFSLKNLHTLKRHPVSVNHCANVAKILGIPASLLVRNIRCEVAGCGYHVTAERHDSMVEHMNQKHPNFRLKKASSARPSHAKKAATRVKKTNAPTGVRVSVPSPEPSMSSSSSMSSLASSSTWATPSPSAEPSLNDFMWNHPSSLFGREVPGMFQSDTFNNNYGYDFISQGAQQAQSYLPQYSDMNMLYQPQASTSSSWLPTLEQAQFPSAWQHPPEATYYQGGYLLPELEPQLDLPSLFAYEPLSSCSLYA